MLSLVFAAAAAKFEGDGDATPGVADTSGPPDLEATVPESPLSNGKIILEGALEGAIGEILLNGELGARLLTSRWRSSCDELRPGAAAAAPAVLDEESPAVSRAAPAS